MDQRTLAAGRSAGPALAVERFVLGPFETNCYIVRARGRSACWIVDASFEPEPMIERLLDDRLEPEAVVLTHAHADHIAGLGRVRETFPRVPILIHEAERDWPPRPDLNLSALMGLPVAAPPPDRLLRDGDVLELAGQRFAVIHTPGHSPGGITLHQPEAGIALVGDALFAGSIGRTDFPGSDHALLIDSIRRRLYTLPDETVIMPGHGPASTIGREKASNPWTRGDPGGQTAAY